MDSILPLLPEGLEDVLRRVAFGGEAAAAPSGVGLTPGRLREFMDDEAAGAAFYTATAARCTLPGCRRALLAAAADERGHLQRLQTEYYLLTGDSYLPAVSAPPREGLLAALRRAYMNELRDARTYAAASETAADGELSAALRGFSADEARHARTMRRLISVAME